MIAGEPPDSPWRDVLSTRLGRTGGILCIPLICLLIALRIGWLTTPPNVWIFFAAFVSALIGVVCLAVAFFRAGREL